MIRTTAAPCRTPTRHKCRIIARQCLLFLALTASLAAALPVCAQDLQNPLETVQVTATRNEQSIHDVAGAVAVVGLDEISRKTPQVLAEMLRGMPGAFFQQTTPGQGVPIIRGLKGSEVLHLVDGMRLNNAFFRNAPSQYLSLVDAYNTQQIEVLRGSAPSLYGADAMGGVVHILTREPVFDGDERQSSGRIYGAVNSVDQSLVTRLEGASGTTRGVISGGVTYQDISHRKDGSGHKIKPSGLTVKAADIKWRGQIGEQGELMLSAQWLEQPDTPRVDELITGYGQEHPASDVYSFRPNSRSFLHARYQTTSSGRFYSHLAIHVARQVIDDDRTTREFGQSEQIEETNRSTLDGLTLQLDTEWGAGNLLTWGAEYYSDQVDSARWVTDLDSNTANRAKGRFPDGASMDSGALYASNSWTTDVFDISGGIRYSWFDIRLPGTSDTQTTHLKPDDLTGDVHLVWKINPSINIASNVGRGFRPPNIFDLGTLGARPGNRFNIPNPALKPESVLSYDLGIKYQDDSVQAELFAFYSDYRDKITSVATGDMTAGGRQIVRSENLNSVKLYGVESGLNWQLNKDLQAVLTINYTWGEEREKNAGHTPADRIPPLNGRAGITWSGKQRLRVESWLDFASVQNRLSDRDISDPRINPDGTAGWGTLNFLVSWRTHSDLELGLRLENILDRNYREHGSGINAPGRNFGMWINAVF